MSTDKTSAVRKRRLKTRVGWRIDADIVDEVRRCVGEEPDAKIVDFVEDALTAHLRKVRRARSKK